MATYNESGIEVASEVTHFRRRRVNIDGEECMWIIADGGMKKSGEVLKVDEVCEFLPHGFKLRSIGGSPNEELLKVLPDGFGYTSLEVLNEHEDGAAKAFAADMAMPQTEVNEWIAPRGGVDL